MSIWVVFGLVWLCVSLLVAALFSGVLHAAHGDDVVETVAAVAPLDLRPSASAAASATGVPMHAA